MKDDLPGLVCRAERFREMAGHNLATVLGVPDDSIQFTSKGVETH